MDATQISGWGVMALGMGVVFLGLVSLVYISQFMSILCKAASQKRKTAVPALKGSIPATAAAELAPIANKPQFTAAVATAIALQMGTEPSGLRIHSIRPVGAASNREQFVAAVSAAVATQIGSDVSGLRIHSIRQV